MPATDADAPPHQAGQAIDVAGNAFEPDRVHVEPPDAFPREAFFDSRIGVLVEQGNAEVARVLLGRRAASHPLDPTVYLDAIRTERTIAPEARAWQAWLERALRQGVELADEARALLPTAALQAFLAKSELDFQVLAKQRSASAARELLRLRLQGMLLNDPRRALDDLERDELAGAAASDRRTRALACGVLRACALDHGARVAALLPRYSVQSGDDPLAHDVQSALDHAAAWTRAQQPEPCPPALARVVALGRVVSTVVARELRAALARELRAQPRQYLRCADAVVASSPALTQWLLSEARALAPAKVFEPDAAALERALTALERALHGDRSALAAWLAPLARLVPGIDSARYRRAARSLCATLIAREGLVRDQMHARLASDRRTALRRLARPLAADDALALIDAWARVAATSEPA